jgi:hypothetical protein
METKGIYIYGIVPNFYGTTQFQSLENSGVYPITFQNISAIVSDRESADLGSIDRESLGHLLVHHQKTIEELMLKGFHMFIPMRLGTIAGSKEEVIKILANGHELMIETLNKIEYLSEIDLAVTWTDFSGTLKFIANHPEIISLKNHILKNIDKISQIDQVKVGILVHEKLDEKNKMVELKILDALASCSLDIKTHQVMNDQMITNSAFLFNRKNKEKFEQVINELDEEYDGKLNFKLVGPLPCYSFYTLEVKELDPDLVEEARKELGMKETTTESEIRKAYLEKAKICHPDNSLDNGDTKKFLMVQNCYHTLLDYSAAVRQSSKEGFISLAKEKVIENRVLVKIKE